MFKYGGLNMHAKESNFKYLLYLLYSGIVVLVAAIIILFYLPRSGVVEIEGQGIYQGQLRGINTFHGEGIWTSENGNRYEGGFKNGIYDGFGVLTYSNNARYIGNFVDGYFHGEGRLILPNGEIQEGLWNKGQLLKP